MNLIIQSQQANTKEKGTLMNRNNQIIHFEFRGRKIAPRGEATV